MLDSLATIYNTVAATIDPSPMDIATFFHTTMGFLSSYFTHLGCVFDKISIVSPAIGFFDIWALDGPTRTCKFNWDF
ncbi:MAG: hypothetical protein LRY56_09370 [Burkholderiaceae bacterium]|nr:hypothetical protein [Burkholderiaceae bacterium]MCD8516990.1 hypothetical protein [Burkholderiaceae bacterium]MCD8537672.1 hypothetical protein [Burkholderiaceae bacterium]